MHDFSYRNNSKDIDLDEMLAYVLDNSKYNINENQFNEIELIFRELWNNSSGKFKCNLDFILHVYDHLVNEGKQPMLDLVEDTVLKILRYMESIGQYTGFSDN
jgi:hypothetical protein